MNPEEVFALLRRADPVRGSEEVMIVSRHRSPGASRWLRPLAISAAAALVVILAIGPFGLLGGDEGPDVAGTTTTAATTSTTAAAPGTAVPAPDTTTPIQTTIPTETTTEPSSDIDRILVADGTAVSDTSGTRVFDVAAAVAYDDLAGGLVYQTESSAFLGAVEETDVWHLEAGDSEPSVLVPQDGDATLRLMGVFDIGGRATAVVVERRNPGDVENAAEIMYEVDVASAEIREIATVGGWERAPDAITWDGSAYVLSTVAEGYSFLSILDREGSETVWSGALPAECFDEPNCPRTLVATADGSQLAFIRTGFFDTNDLVLWDRRTDTEIWSVALGPESVLGAPIVHGDTIVVNRYRGPNRDPGIGPATVVDRNTGDLSTVGRDGFAAPIDALG